MNTGGAIDGRLKDRLPCGSVGEGDVWVNDETCYIPDVVATCVPLSDEGYVADPFLVVEILSNSDRGKRAREKVDGYMTLPSVQEIWLVDSRKRWLQQWRRAGEDSWIVGLPLTGPATFASPTLGGEPVALDELYFNTGL